MKSRILLFGLVVASVLSLAGCGGGLRGALFGPSAGEEGAMIVALILGIPAIVIAIRLWTRSRVLIASEARRLRPREENARYDVFVSYSATDSAVAERLANRLCEAGVSVFFAEKEISGGDEFGDKIKESLAESRELWLLASPASVQSTWVATEWGTAWALDKKIVPVLHDLTAQELPDRLRAVHSIDLSNVDREIQNLSSRRNREAKNILVLAALCLVFGPMGAHRFYVGKWRSALLQLGSTVYLLSLSPALVLVWPLVDLFVILLGRFRDSYCRYITWSSAKRTTAPPNKSLN